MDFVKSHFEKMKLWPVEHFWLTFFPDQHWSAADLEKKWAKSVQLVRVSFFRSDFLQNPYFSRTTLDKDLRVSKRPNLPRLLRSGLIFFRTSNKRGFKITYHLFFSGCYCWNDFTNCKRLSLPWNSLCNHRTRPVWYSTFSLLARKSQKFLG